MAEIFDLDPVDASNTARWPENMQYSAVNDAGRADEGLLARWYLDHNGSVVASGSANDFAITSNRTIAALVDDITMVFTANHTITGPARVNLNGIGLKDIKRFNGQELAQGDIISGQPVAVHYKSALDYYFMTTAPAALVTSSFVDLSENAAPGDPAANTGRLYAKDVSTKTLLAYRDSAGLERVIPGLSEVGYKLLASGTVAAAATLDIVLTSYTAYRALKLVLINFIPVNDDVQLYLRFSSDGGANYDASGYNYVQDGRNDADTLQSLTSTSANQIVIAGGLSAGNAIGNAATEGISGEIMLFGQAETTAWNKCTGLVYWIDADATPQANLTRLGGSREAAQDTDAIRLQFESGNIASGKWALLGVP